MNEATWHECSDLGKMLAFLHGRASERKRRLFGAACCRRIWGMLEDERLRNAVETAERFADGLASKEDILAAEEDAFNVYEIYRDSEQDALMEAADTVYTVVCAGVPWDIAEVTADNAADAVKEADSDVAREGEVSAQLRLLRCVFGNPFRSETVSDEVLRWNDGTVRKMAQVIYEERRFEDMPILADAMEEAGWSGDALLCHCREAGEHTRGCWVLDSILGRE